MAKTTKESLSQIAQDSPESLPTPSDYSLVISGDQDVTEDQIASKFSEAQEQISELRGKVCSLEEKNLELQMAYDELSFALTKGDADLPVIVRQLEEGFHMISDRWWLMFYLSLMHTVNGVSFTQLNKIHSLLVTLFNGIDYTEDRLRNERKRKIAFLVSYYKKALTKIHSTMRSLPRNELNAFKKEYKAVFGKDA